MKFFVYLCLFLMLGCNIKQKNSNCEILEFYVNKYPKESKFLNQKLVVNGLKNVLDGDYQDYMDFVKIAGNGKISLKDNYLITDISQLNVGGFNSILLINLSTCEFHLFWLKSIIVDKKFKLYHSEKDISIEVLQFIIEVMNEKWSHVAKFSIVDNAIIIKEI